MVIYKVKIKIKAEAEKEWFNWMSIVHIKDVINTGHFIDYTFMKLLLNGTTEPNTVTYEIQYVCKNQEELDAYKANDAEALREEHRQKFEYAVLDTSRSEYSDVTEIMIQTEMAYHATQ
jgi:hypothetical protein